MSVRVEVDQASVRAFCDRWRVRELALFGSVLRSDFDQGSDIDVLVSFAPGVDWSLLDHVTMQDELRSIFGRQVDLVSREGLAHSRNVERRGAIMDSAEVIYARS